MKYIYEVLENSEYVTIHPFSFLSKVNFNFYITIYNIIIKTMPDFVSYTSII